MWKQQDIEIEVQDVTKAEGSGDLVLTAVAVDKQKSANRNGFQFDWDKPSDVVVTNWARNPVFLFWHDHRGYPLGVVEKIEINTKQVKIQVRIPDMSGEPGFEDLDRLFYAPVRTMIKKGMLRAVSIGFIPLEAEWVDQDGKRFVRVKKFEILECSLVTIGAHETAIITKTATSKKKSDQDVVEAAKLVNQWFEETPSVPEPMERLQTGKWARPGRSITQGEEQEVITLSYEEHESETPVLSLPISDDEILRLADGFADVGLGLQKSDDGWSVQELKWRGIPYSRHGDVQTAPVDASWDGPAEVKEADTDDLAKMCAIEDDEKLSAKAGYKLPHHKQQDHKVVLRGVQAAMASVLGARGGVDVPDVVRKQAYKHLVKHYEQFDKEAPDFQDYDTEALADLHKQGMILVPGMPEVEESAPVKTQDVDVSGLEDRISRIEQALGMHDTPSDDEVETEVEAQAESPGEDPEVPRKPTEYVITEEAVRAIVVEALRDAVG